ncbi:hypothetical protein PSHT_09236 [Puccinia striiformis]|uniref:Uncharacterized protein n=1 Tax=Puccinia striiformis TaxID=27350 RepID=A0A2S4VHY4_9BASI|nr:hypothetical protein PSHT_09236 [Puccinia striiformis]
MSTTTDTVVANRFLLTTSNYAIWLLPTTAKLHDLGIRDLLVDNSKPDVDNLTLVTTMLPLADQFDGRKLWVLLKNKYAGNDHVARSTALDSFIDVEFKDVKSFCSAMRLANQKMVLANILNNNEVKIMIMLRQLPDPSSSRLETLSPWGFRLNRFENILKRLESYAISNNIKSERPPQTCFTLALNKAPPRVLQEGDFSYFRTSDGVRHHVDEM